MLIQLSEIDTKHAACVWCATQCNNDSDFWLWFFWPSQIPRTSHVRKPKVMDHRSEANSQIESQFIECIWIGWLRNTFVSTKSNFNCNFIHIFSLWQQWGKKFKWFDDKMARCPDGCCDKINFFRIKHLPPSGKKWNKQIHSENMTDFPASLMDCKE